VLWWDSWAKAASARAGVRGPEVREWIAPRILWRFGEAWFEVVMRAMTRVVLALALDQAADWQGRGQYLTIAVNLSASSLVDTDLPEEVAAMIAARGVPPCVLQLEVTEEFLMADRERARDILTRLQHDGVQISVDDFRNGAHRSRVPAPVRRTTSRTPMNKPGCEVARRASQDAVERRS